VKYETVVTELFVRFPNLQATYCSEYEYLCDEPPMPYIVFGDMLMPELARALEAKDLGVILRICAFLEDVAEAARQENNLRTLMKVEVGEWLEFAANEDVLLPWLGMETKLVCDYVPGLATQRRKLAAEKETKSIRSYLSSRIKSLLRK
jgi:hypothetical protein